MITLADARRIIAAAEKKAEEIEQPMNIAVVDEGGNLVAHVRMDKAWRVLWSANILSKPRLGLRDVISPVTRSM